VFRVLQDHGGVTDDEMVRVFNMGIGMIAIVPPDRVAEVRESARQAAVETWDIGEVVEGEGVELS
jgi:phosphoribosylaminoimidazole (AIR) synthetase